jgi:hypothetical protein
MQFFCVAESTNNPSISIQGKSVRIKEIDCEFDDIWCSQPVDRSKLSREIVRKATNKGKIACVVGFGTTE